MITLRRLVSKIPTAWRAVLCCVIALLSILLALRPAANTHAAAVLTITPITFNVLGLDDQDFNEGPNAYPVGARVCNTGDQPATNVAVTFHWDGEDPFVNLTGPSSQSLASLVNGNCSDFYFTVTLSRELDTYLSTRRYHIEAAADGLGPVSTPSGREIWVNDLVLSTDINAGAISGPASVTVGQTVQYTVQGASSANLEQLEHFIDFPSDIFKLVSVAAAYQNPSGATNDKLYADACGWDPDPANETTTYLSCIGPANYSGGVVGGNLTLTYTVQVIAPGTATLSHVVYGFQNSSDLFLYNMSTSAVPVTATGQVTETPTGTITTTATITGTQTVTVTPTITGTVTPTVTGTPPTSTATGTITPNVSITNAVSPNEARVGQNFTFTVRVTNSGTAPATNTVVTDSFSSYLNISSAVTTKGTATTSTSTRTVTVNIGTLNPNETVTITIITSVNNTAPANTNVNNAATVTWSQAGVNRSANSNTVTLRILGSSTLPGTGGMEIEPPGAQGPQIYWPALASGLLLLLLGLAAFALSARARTRQPQWSGWYARTALILSAAGLLFGVAAWALTRDANGVRQISLLIGTPDASLQATPTVFLPSNQDPAPVYPTPTPERLPDYPVPTPSVMPTPGENQQEPDISEVTRIVIPALSLDTVVKYVPYDGNTWLIGGLKQEIAWMGDTSWPGLGGNTALAGHVSLWDGGDGPFRRLEDLQSGDVVYLYTQRNVYTYQVRHGQVVSDADLSVVQPSDSAQLTLITCSGWDAQQKLYLSRVIVISDLIEVKPLFNQAASN